MKRVENGDVEAMVGVGYHYHKGEHGLPQDSDKALELWHHAGERLVLSQHISLLV